MAREDGCLPTPALHDGCLGAQVRIDVSQVHALGKHHPRLLSQRCPLVSQCATEVKPDDEMMRNITGY